MENIKKALQNVLNMASKNMKLEDKEKQKDIEMVRSHILNGQWEHDNDNQILIYTDILDQ